MYSQQCERANSIDELLEISYILRMDFCQRVKDSKRNKYSDLLTNKCLEYIHSHRFETMNAKIISNELKVSSSYLCSHIKKETGISIVDHIINEKIDLSKQLLRNTDYSLNEISSLLSFSSQAYFQKVFKEKTGQTPMRYKNSLK